jgi:hypothetical protein
MTSKVDIRSKQCYLYTQNFCSLLYSQLIPLLVMKAALLLAFGAALNNALPRQKRKRPCPCYRETDNPLEPIIEGSYSVKLRPGYTLEEHFKFVGYNLSTQATMFDYMKSINTYRLNIDENTMHNIIRYDHGVQRIFQDVAFDPQLPWFNVTEIPLDEYPCMDEMGQIVGFPPCLDKNTEHWGQEGSS